MRGKDNGVHDVTEAPEFIHTPATPSRKATRRVKDVLPVPTQCPYCGGPVSLVSNAVIYGREYGEYPWAYACDDLKGCNSYVGLHAYTAIPLGTLADKRTREARKRAKDVFNPWWQDGHMTRSRAYAKLAALMNVDVGACHIGWFSAEDCDRVYAICLDYRKTLCTHS